MALGSTVPPFQDPEILTESKRGQSTESITEVDDSVFFRWAPSEPFDMM